MIGVYIAILIFIICVFIGLYIKHSIKKELLNIEEYYSFLKWAKNKLLAEKCRIDEIFLDFLKDKKAGYVKEIYEKLKEGASKNNTNLNIVDFWKGLGKISYIELEDNIKKHIEEIELKLDDCRKNYNKNGELYGKLGIICGLFLFIILI